MAAYVIFFLIISLFAIEYEFNPFQSEIPFLAITISLVLFAGLRGFDVDKDYLAYQTNFELIAMYGFPQNLILMEPSFVGLVSLVRLFFETNYGAVIFFIIALFAVSLKMTSIRKMSVNPFWAALFYYVHFFFLHEMTQIRIGIASAIFITAFPYFQNKRRMAFVLMVLLAASFHYSALFFLFFLFFDTSTFNRYLYAGIILAAFLLAVLRLPLFDYINLLGDTGFKYDAYVQNVNKGEAVKINVVNVISMITLFYCLILGFVVNKEKLLSNKVSVIALKSTIISYFILCLLSGAPTITFRFSELFGFFSVFLFASAPLFIPNKKIASILLLITAGIIFYINIFYGEGLLKDYKMVSF